MRVTKFECDKTNDHNCTVVSKSIVSKKKNTQYHGKKWFCYGNKIRDKHKIFVTATKNFAAATKRFVDRTKHFAAVTKFFCYPYFNK